MCSRIFNYSSHPMDLAVVLLENPILLVASAPGAPNLRYHLEFRTSTADA